MTLKLCKSMSSIMAAGQRCIFHLFHQLKAVWRLRCSNLLQAKPLCAPPPPPTTLCSVISIQLKFCVLLFVMTRFCHFLSLSPSLTHLLTAKEAASMNGVNCAVAICSTMTFSLSPSLFPPALALSLSIS